MKVQGFVASVWFYDKLTEAILELSKSYSGAI